MIGNNDRAMRAKIGLVARIVVHDRVSSFDAREAAGDMICDTLHFCRANGLDPEKMLSNAKQMFDIEEAEDGGPATEGVW